MKHTSMNRGYYYITLLAITLFISSNISQAKSVVPNDDEYMIGADVMPTPIGGIEGIIKKINSMGLMRDTKKEGKVYLLVYINSSGEVDDAKIVKGIGGGCDESAIEAVKKTKFTPGESGGKSVKVKMSLAIAFKAG